MGTPETSSHKTLVCGGCGKRYRVPASVNRKGLKCKDCGAELRLLREKLPDEAGGYDRNRGAPQKPLRRKKSPIPVFVALLVSAILAVVAVMLIGNIDILHSDEADAEKVDKRISMRDPVEMSPYMKRVDKMVESFKAYRIEDFPTYLETKDLFEFSMRQKKEKKGWKDLSLTQQLTYLDTLRTREPFTARWRRAEAGEWREMASSLPGHLDCSWIVIPRSFKTGDADEAWFLVRNDAGRPKVVGYKLLIKKAPKIVRTDEKFEIPAVNHKPDFKRLNPELNKSALPATTADGTIDETGSPVAPIKAVPLLEGSSPGLVIQIKTHINTLTNPDATRKAQEAKKELVFIGKSAIPVLLNCLVGKDLKNSDEVFYCHQVIQALRDITGKRFGFEPQTGERILTAASTVEQVSALRKWFGWWKINHKTFEPELTPQLKKELEKRDRWRKKFGK